MRDDTTRWAARAAAAIIVLLALANTALIVEARHAFAGATGDLLFNVMGALAGVLFGSIGLLIAVRARNVIGWILVFAGFFIALETFGGAYAAVGLVANPGSLPAPKVVAALLQPMSVLLFTSLGLMLLLFPDGDPPTPRWRPVIWLGIGAAAVAYVGFALNPVPLNPFGDYSFINPLGIETLAGVISTVLVGTNWVLVLSIVAGFAALVVRFRRGNDDLRHQVRWLGFTAVAAGACILVVATSLVVCRCDQAAGGNIIFLLFTLILLVGIPGSIAIAILKYRLYDIDVIISKAVLYGLLAAFFTAVYVAIVIGVGAAVGNRGNSALTVLAAVVIAIAFQPVRERSRHLANRVVFGKRATPYEVLSEFSDRMAGTYSSEDVLPRMAQILLEGTGGTSARVWLRFGDELRLAVSRPREGSVPPVPVTDDHPAWLPDEHGVEVRHQGELLGALSLGMPPSDPMNPTKEKLVRDLASQAGLVLRNARLIEDVRASRRRIVSAQDARAKGLERNIHDGAQQQLIALAVKERLVISMIAKDPDRAAQMMNEIQSDTVEALETLRDLARGIYPPLLADKGLSAALESQTRKVALPVTVEGDGLGRYEPEVEAAVYFCCLEALQNIAKYAEAHRATIHLEARDGRLTFEVADNGKGFDRGSTGYGTGLQGMADRVAALGGTLDVRSSVGAGTTVVGSIPVA